MVDPAPLAADTPSSDEPVGALVHRLAEQVPELIRSELRLAQAELATKGVAAGIVTLAGRRQVRAATPAAPERAITGVREDVAALKGHHP